MIIDMKKHLVKNNLNPEQYYFCVRKYYYDPLETHVFLYKASFKECERFIKDDKYGSRNIYDRPLWKSVAAVSMPADMNSYQNSVYNAAAVYPHSMAGVRGCVHGCIDPWTVRDGCYCISV